MRVYVCVELMLKGATIWFRVYWFYNFSYSEKAPYGHIAILLEVWHFVKVLCTGFCEGVTRIRASRITALKVSGTCKWRRAMQALGEVSVFQDPVRCARA